MSGNRVLLAAQHVVQFQLLPRLLKGVEMCWLGNHNMTNVAVTTLTLSFCQGGVISAYSKKTSCLTEGADICLKTGRPAWKLLVFLEFTRHFNC